MARVRRDHEDHLEANEPVAVVLLHDLASLLEDVSEVVLDLAKLQRSRPEDVADLFKTAKTAPTRLATMIPGEILQVLMGAGMQVAGAAQRLKASVAPDGGAEGKKGLAAIDLAKVQPEALEAFGAILGEKVTALQAAIAKYEAGFLKTNPPA